MRATNIGFLHIFISIIFIISLSSSLSISEQLDSLLDCIGDDAEKYNVTVRDNYIITVAPLMKQDRLSGAGADQLLFNCIYIYLTGSVQSETGPWDVATDNYRNIIDRKLASGEIPCGRPSYDVSTESMDVIKNKSDNVAFLVKPDRVPAGGGEIIHSYLYSRLNTMCQTISSTGFAKNDHLEDVIFLFMSRCLQRLAISAIYGQGYFIGTRFIELMASS